MACWFEFVVEWCRGACRVIQLAPRHPDGAVDCLIVFRGGGVCLGVIQDGRRLWEEVRVVTE